MLEALRAVSTFFTENNIRTRRNLRGEIERRSLLVNQQFVEAFSLVTKVCKFDYGNSSMHSLIFELTIFLNTFIFCCTFCIQTRIKVTFPECFWWCLNVERYMNKSIFA